MMNIKTYLIKRTEPLRPRKKYTHRTSIIDGETKRYVSPKETDVPIDIPRANRLRKRAGSNEDDAVTDWTPEIPFKNVIKFNFL